jgi:hypothetical protein
MKRFTFGSSAVVLAGALAFAMNVQASGDHDGGHGHSDKHNDTHQGDHHGSDNGHDDKHAAGAKHDGMFLKEVSIDGYKVSFHIMKAKPGKEMGGSHDFMIKVENAGKAMSDVAINTKVVHPNGKAESKRVMKMGDWHMAGYDLGHEGKHQVMILFKTPDGKKHKGGIYY